MSDTVESSIRSIYRHTDEQYEILVVDGGSEDGSLEILRDLEDELERLRIIVNDTGELSDDRNVGVTEAIGSHVLLQMDTDDVYGKGIRDFVKIYDSIYQVREEPFYLKGNNINIGKRDFLLEYGPYRPGLNRGEDHDLWRRLFASEDIIWLEHQAISESIGYDQSMLDRARERVDRFRTDLITGVEPVSIAKWILSERSNINMVYDLLILCVLSFATSLDKQYTLPETTRKKNDLRIYIDQNQTTVREMESNYDVSICDSLSEVGKEVFCSDYV